MATSKAKRSPLTNATRRNNRRVSSQKQSVRPGGPPAKPATELQNHQLTKFVLPRPHRTWFPQAKGRVIKQVEFFSDADNNTLELSFKDNTSLSFEFEPCFIWEAYFGRWKSGEHRILHRWKPVIST